MKQSIARALRRLADRFDPAQPCVINIQNINGKPVTEDLRRVLEAQLKLDQARQRATRTWSF